MKPNILKFLTIFNQFLIIFLFSFTVFQIVSLNQQKISLIETERKIKKIFGENENLEAKLSEIDTFSKVEEKIAKDNFVKAQNVKYFNILSGVASK
jgi:hypothetical protein